MDAALEKSPPSGRPKVQGARTAGFVSISQAKRQSKRTWMFDRDPKISVVFCPAFLEPNRVCGLALFICRREKKE